MRGSRRRWRSLARPAAVLKLSSPSASTQTIVECGEPSCRSVVTVPTKGCPRNVRALSSRVAMDLLSVAARLVARCELAASRGNGGLAELASAGARRGDRGGAACRPRPPGGRVLDRGRGAARALLLARGAPPDRVARSAARARRRARAAAARRAGAAALRPADDRGRRDAGLLQLPDRRRPPDPARGRGAELR